MVEFYLKLKLILRIISYLTYICWEIDNFVIKSDIFKRFFICKNILKKLSCYHDNYFRYFMFGKYNGFVSKARVSACMYFLVCYYAHIISTDEDPGLRIESFAVINLRGVSTNKTIIFYRHANIQRTYFPFVLCFITHAYSIYNER